MRAGGAGDMARVEPGGQMQDAARTRPRAPRSIVVDVVRGLAITLVVLGHTNQGIIHRGWWRGSKVGDQLDAAIYTFHMPAFFFVSGIFLCAGVAKRGERRYAFEKARVLLYPYVLWSVLSWGSVSVFHRYMVQGVPSVRQFLMNLATGNSSWFLPTIFVALMLGMMLRRVPMPALFALAWLGEVLLPRTHWSDLDRAFDHLPFLVMGMWVGMSFGKIEKVAKWVSGVGAGVLLAVIVAVAGAGLAAWKPLFVPLGLAGTLMLMLVARVLGQGWVARAFAWAGEGSFGIFLLSQFPQGGGRELVRQVFHVTAPLPQLIVPTVLAVGIPGYLYQYRERLKIGWLFVWPFDGKTKAG